MNRVALVVCCLVVGVCVVACGGGGKPGFEPPTAKARIGRAPGAIPGVPQLDDPEALNNDPEDFTADPDGKFLDTNPFLYGEVVTIRAQRHDPFAILATKDSDHLYKWETPRNQVDPSGLPAFEQQYGILRLTPGTKVAVNGSQALWANVTVKDGPHAGRHGYVLPGTVGRAAKLLEWRRKEGR